MKYKMEEVLGDGEFLTLPAETIIQVQVVEDPTPREVPGRDGKEGWTSLSFKFKIVDIPSKLMDEYGILVGTTIWGSVSAKFTEHPDNKLRQWAEALLDIGELTGGFELDTEMLIGHRARGVVGQYTKSGSTTVNHKIIGLLPLTPAMASTASQPAFAGGFTVGGGFTDEPPF